MKIPSSPPRQRRDDVLQYCLDHGGRLCEGQIFYDEQGKPWAPEIGRASCRERV